MQHLMLATSEGQWVLPGTPEFFTALGDSESDYDPLSFAVENLWFVKLEVLNSKRRTMRHVVVQVRVAVFEMRFRPCLEAVPWRFPGDMRGEAAFSAQGSARARRRPRRDAPSTTEAVEGKPQCYAIVRRQHPEADVGLNDGRSEFY